MTFRYQLIVGGEQLGESLSSSDEVRSALQRYFKQHPEHARSGRVLVGRMMAAQPEAPAHGRGVYRARAFLENAPNPDPDEEFWHGRLRDILNSQLRQRDFFLWLHASGSGQSQLDEPGFLRAVEHGLSAIGPLVHREPAVDVDSLERFVERRDRGEWSWQGKEFEWADGGLHVRLTAIPRRREVANEPAHEVVGNPEPAFAYYG
jgi:hypothetical protein